jgi:hypothetical protein
LASSRRGCGTPTTRTTENAAVTPGVLPGRRAERDAAFDPDAVGDAEYDYWVIHREIVGQVDRAPLIASLTRIPARLYGVREACLIPSATERERAVRLVDHITSGQQPPTEGAWNEITRALVHTYELMKAEIAVCRLSDA